MGQNEDIYSSRRKLIETSKFRTYAFRNEILKIAKLQHYFLTRLIKIYLFPLRDISRTKTKIIFKSPHTSVELVTKFFRRVSLLLSCGTQIAQ